MCRKWKTCTSDKSSHAVSFGFCDPKETLAKLQRSQFSWSTQQCRSIPNDNCNPSKGYFRQFNNLKMPVVKGRVCVAVKVLFWNLCILFDKIHFFFPSNSKPQNTKTKRKSTEKERDFWFWENGRLQAIGFLAGIAFCIGGIGVISCWCGYLGYWVSFLFIYLFIICFWYVSPFYFLPIHYNFFVILIP